MSCHEIEALLDDYLDEEIETAAAGRVERHLESCSSCRETLASLRTVVEAAEALPRDLEPERDLWPGIEGRIAPPGRAVQRGTWAAVSWVGLAAAAVLVAAVVLQLSRPDVTIAPQPVAPTAEAPTELPEYVRVSDEVRSRNGLMQVREDLLRSIEEHRHGLDPETRELVDRNLVLIDQAITEIQLALEEDPDNQGLELLLAATYQREVDFLKQINML